MRKKTILWAEDDYFLMEPMFEEVRDMGFDVINARNGNEVVKLLEENHNQLALVILDMAMPTGDSLSSYETHAGRRTGLALAREIRKKYPTIPLLGCSVSSEPEIIDWFTKYGSGYLHKPVPLSEVAERIENIVLKRKIRPKPKCFIVHGHDSQTLYELKGYIENTLGFDEPIILQDQPSFGRTIIEKFEDESRRVDVVFILLTPDDKVATRKDSSKAKLRARQNVIFEMGYFLGKLERKKGRIILLHKGAVDLPSDISGVVYVDITNGIKQADKILRKELDYWLGQGK